MNSSSSLSRSYATQAASFWPATLALGLGSFVVFVNLYITQPMLPFLVQHFAISPLMAGQTFTITTATLAVSLLVFGPLSEVVGRRPLMLSATAGAVVCTGLLSWADSFSSMLVLRAAQGFFLAGLPAIALAYMREEFEASAFRIAVGVYISANSLGGIGGRLLGGFFIEHFSLSQSFALLASLSIVLLLPVFIILPQSRGFQQQSWSSLRPRKVAQDIYSHLSNPVLLLAYMIGGLNFFIFVNQFSYATFRLTAAPYELSPSILGMLFLTYLSGTVGAALGGRWLRRWSAPQIMRLGVILLMLGSLVTLSDALPWIIVGFLINALGFFLAHANASGWVSRHAEHTPATASSVYLVCYYLGASSGGYYLDPFWNLAGWPGVVWASIVVLIINLFMTLRLRRYERKMADCR